MRLLLDTNIINFVLRERDSVLRRFTDALADIGDVIEEAAQRQSLAVGLPGQHLLGDAFQEVDRPPPDLAEVLEDLAVSGVHGS